VCELTVVLVGRIGGRVVLIVRDRFGSPDVTPFNHSDLAIHEASAQQLQGPCNINQLVGIVILEWLFRV
jgi:hypothetical protein